MTCSIIWKRNVTVTEAIQS